MDERVNLRQLLSHPVEALLRATLASADMGVLVTDLDHESLMANARFGELWGLDPAIATRESPEALREKVRHRLTDEPTWRRNLDEIYADPSRSNRDLLHLKHPVAVLERVTTPLRDESGAILGRLWTFRDVTERHRQEQMAEVLRRTTVLYHSEPRQVYERLTQEVADFYGSISLLSLLDGDRLEFRAVGLPRGFPVPDQRGNQLDDSYCQFCLQSNEPVLIQDASSDQRLQGLAPARLGLTRYGGVPILGPSGATVGTLCFLDSRSDEPLGDLDRQFLSLISMRIGTELVREQHLAALETDLRLTHDALRETESKLIEQEKLAITGTLAAATAHDIRNILSAVRLEMSMSQAPEVALRAVQTHLDRFQVMCHRLMSYAQPGQVVAQPFRVAEVLSGVIRLLEPHIALSRIHVHMDADRQTMLVADEGRIEHLFVNLTLNAIQAMPHGGRLFLRVFERNQELVVEIEDTGVGITADRLEEIFEPFASSRSDGFGLGLFSSRQIVRESGGEMRVQSTVGEGTTFSLRWPTA